MTSPIEQPAVVWQPIETAPKDGTDIQAHIPGNGQDNVIAWQAEAFLNSEGQWCGGWVFTTEQEPPDCWTDGICWEVNEDGVPSVQPVAWMPLPSPPGAVMTNETSRMADIPQWAFKRAWLLLNAEDFDDCDYYCGTPETHKASPGGKAFARYIAEHEEPPVDEIAEALRATFGAAAPEFVRAFKNEIAKRGLQITETRK